MSLIAALPCAGASAVAQMAYSPVNTTDAYGNARPIFQDRRNVGVFQNQVQQQALRGYQEEGRRGYNRGGANPFILPSDIRLFRPPPPTVSANQLFPGVPAAQEAREAYLLYGSFEPPTRPLDDSDPGMNAMLRRRMLIEATTLNAPIHRSLAQNTATNSLRSAVEPPSLRVPTAPTDDSAPTRTIEQSLREGVDQAYARTRNEAWAWFREGEYRRAARAFATATMLDSSDVESITGEILAHWFEGIAVGAFRTAAAALEQAVRHGNDVLGVQLDLPSVFRDPRTAQTMGIQARLQASLPDISPTTAALDALVLWHLGQRTDALRIAQSLARRPEAAAYADWPEKMKAAAAAAPAPVPSP